MSSKKEKKNVRVNLGNPEVAKISTIMYSYLFPVFYGLTAIVLLFNKAWLVFLIFVVLCVITLPQVKKILEGYHIKGIIKLVICLGLLYLAFLSSNLYI